MKGNKDTVTRNSKTSRRLIAISFPNKVYSIKDIKVQFLIISHLEEVLNEYNVTFPLIYGQILG